MIWLASPLMILLLAIIFIVISFYLISKVKKLNKSLNDLSSKEVANGILFSDLNLSIQNVDKKLLNKIEINRENIQKFENERQQQIMHLEQQIHTLKAYYAKVFTDLSLLKEQQHPKDKLYSRAYKLASLGADVEEIMRECDLPKAEADLLLTVYQQSQEK